MGDWVGKYFRSCDRQRVQSKPIETSCGGYQDRQTYVRILCSDVFVVKLDPSGTQVLYATYLGGQEQDVATSITASPSGGVYVIGYSSSPDFPVTSGVVQTQNHGPVIYANGPGPVLQQGDAFITKFNQDGSIAYSTFLGGTGTDVPTQIIVDSADFAYVAGYTYSTDFPITASPLSKGPAVGFLAKINPAGSVLAFSTYYPGAISGLALDAIGSSYIAGTTKGPNSGDAFVTKISPEGNGIVYTNDLGPWALSLPIVVDSLGHAWVYRNGLLEVSQDGGQIGERLPGDGSDSTALAIDANDNLYVTGYVYWPMQTTANAALASPCAQPRYIIELNSAGEVIYSSYLRQIPLLSGMSVTAPGQVQFDATVHMDLTSKAPLSFGCPVNAASLVERYVAPGEIITLFGYGLGPQSGVAASPTEVGRIPTTLAGVQVLADGVPVPVLYAQSGQINVVMRAGQFTRTITVTYDGQSAPALDLPINYTDPGVFAVLNQDGSVNTASNPAPRGSILQCFVTGFWLDPTLVPEDGAILPLTSLTTLGYFPPAKFMVRKLRKGQPIYLSADVTWAGLAPGLVLGVEQINVRIPTDIPRDELRSVSLVLSDNPSVSVAVFIAQ